MTRSAITQRATAAAQAAPDDLDEWAADPALPVRLTVAMREDIPTQTVRRLAHDPAPEVRAAVLVTGAPVDLVRQLTMDSHRGVARLANQQYADIFRP